MRAHTSRRSMPPLNSGTSPTSSSERRIVASISAMAGTSPPANTVSTRRNSADSSVASCSRAGGSLSAMS